MTTPEIKTLRALTTLPLSLMTIYDNEAEAVESATKRGVPFAWHFPPIILTMWR